MERTLIFGPAGWVQYEPGGVLLRVQERDGRLVVTEIYMGGESAITARALREIPVGYVEAVVNREEAREVIEACMGEEPPKLEPSTSLQSPKWDLSKPKHRRIALRLKLPSSRPYDDLFYMTVASVYSRLAEDGESPAKALAEANNVPVGTVHGWVKAARERGMLPPGRRGTRG